MEYREPKIEIFMLEWEDIITDSNTGLGGNQTPSIDGELEF